MKVIKKFRDKGKDAFKSLGRKRTPSGSRATSVCGSTVSFTDPAVSPSSEDVSTGATQTNSINLTAPPSSSASASHGSTRLAPDSTILAPPIAGTLETPDRVETIISLGLPGTQEPSSSSSSGTQLLVIGPQISISISEPEQDNGKWLWGIYTLE